VCGAQLREIRSLLFAGAKEYDEFSQHLKTFNMCLITSVKDLRSQVVREACFTIAYVWLAGYAEEYVHMLR
jgi:CLIP-associating protein 1/2